MKRLKRVYFEIHNPKLGALSALAQGLIVYWVNHKYGFAAAFLAALKGGFASFLTGGFFGRITERFSEIRSPLAAYPLGMTIPTCIAYTFIGLIHYTTATPVPFWSTVIPMALSMFVYSPVTIFVLRRGFFRVNRSRPPVRGARSAAASDRLEQAAELTRAADAE